MSIHVLQSDAARLPFADKTFSLTLGSPPYMDARTYGIGVQRKCLEWVEWMLGVTREAVRVTDGLVLWVVAGVTRKKCYWPGPEMLLAEWWKRGGQCWRPAYWHRVGVPGSGGKQWLRADVEYVLAFKGAGDLSWSDNTACGHPPKWGPGGEMSHRLSNGARVNQWGYIGSGNRRANGSRRTSIKRMRQPNGSRETQAYTPPVLANPGNLIKTNVGGGLLGHKLAHENEAPYPEALVEFFVKSFCPPNGRVLDPFSGSGTTIDVADRLGRKGVGCDLRMSQCVLAKRRCFGELYAGVA